MVVFFFLVDIQCLFFYHFRSSDISISTEKNVVIHEHYWKARIYNDGFAVVVDTITKLSGFVSRSHYQRNIPCIYAQVKDFSEKLAPVKDVKTGKWGYINIKGDTVITFLYDDACCFGYGRKGRFSASAFKGLAYVNIGVTHGHKFGMFTDGKWGLINQKGEVVLPIKYAYISSPNDGFASVFEGEISDSNEPPFMKYIGKLGFINSAGEVIIPPQYDFHFESRFHNGVAEVKKDGKTFYINTKGKKVKVKNK
jgi:hypothetical protein